MSEFLDRIATFSPKRLALLALELNEQVERLKREERQPIAIVGMGCRFPGGADSPEALWELVRAGRDAISPAPADRWSLDQPVEGLPGRPQGGFIDRVDLFDPLFFGISPRETEMMDPQQRLLLEVAWEALEDAGIPVDELQGTRTGVFVGILGNDFSQRLLDQHPAKLDGYIATGGSHAVASGRLAYTWNLAGPCLSIDTACSASLVAVSAACDSLRSGRSNLALAGGVGLILSPEMTVLLAKGGMLSASFRCKSFDAAADGFVRGEGCGVLVLKRLADAERDGDSIVAVIRGTAVNHDGRSNGLTAPSGPAQQAVLREALEDAGLKPAQVQFVEAHGTGTPLGDPIEAQALAAVFGEGRPADQPLLVGSIKANIGHLEAAAGIAGLMKLALAIRHGEIPPQLHLNTPNPHVDWQSMPLALPTQATPWPGERSKRAGGVSSFGFSGTNAHVILTAAPEPARSAFQERPQHLLCLSARSDAALQAVAGRYADFLARHEDANSGDVCFTANRGRAHHEHRLAVLGETNAQLRENLLKSRAQGKAPSPEVVFLFTGQGSQYAGMGRELYRTQSTFRAAIDRCGEVLAGLWERSLVDVLCSDEADKAGLLNQTAFTQPALFAVEFALAELLQSWGIRPAAVLGHSVGEYAAACVAGVFTPEEGLNLIAARAQLMQALPAGGGMVAVLAAENDVVRAVAPFSKTLSIAAFNGPMNVVVSGPLTDLDQFVRRLETQNLSSQRLTVSHAFHSALLDPALDAFEAAAQAVSYAEPRCVVISNLTGQPATAGELRSAAYWRAHARQPVRFAAGMQALRGLGYKTFVEVGPAPVLSGMGRRIVTDADCRWLPALRRGRGDWEQLLDTLGELYTSGASIDWAAFDRDYPRRKLSLPTYPFERSRYWPEITGRKSRREDAGSAETFRDWLYEFEWQTLADTAPTRHTPGRWVLWCDEQGTGMRLAAALRERGEECLIVNRGSGADHERIIKEFRGSNPAECRGAVYLWGLDASIDEESTLPALQGAVEDACRGALAVVQALVEAGGLGNGSLSFVTRGGEEPVQAALWGLGGVVASEHPELHCRRIALDDSGDGSLALLDELLRDDRETDQVALRGNSRSALRLKRAAARDLCYPARRLRPDASYLVTGGLTGLGLETAGWLVGHGAMHLVLAGRRPPGEQAQAALEAWAKAGVDVTCIQADIGDTAGADTVFAAINQLAVPLRGVIHCAGALDDAFLLQQDWGRFQRVFKAKVEGTWNLHTRTRSADLDFFVLFSSAASLLGSMGQANYAAANAFMDGLALYRRSLELPALSINWSAWSETGIAAGRDVIERSKRSGLNPIDTANGLRALECLLASGSARAAVLPIDWKKFGGDSGLFAGLRAQQATSAAINPAIEARHWRGKLQAADPARRRAMLQEMVARESAKILGIDSSQAIDPRQPLQELGLDSLMALQLRNTLAIWAGIDLPSALLYNFPSVGELTDHLAARMSEEQRGDTEPTQFESILDLDSMTEDDLVRMLQEQIERA